MKKKITLILFAVIAAAVLLMGIMEKILSEIGGTPAIIIAYSVIAVILIILYIKTKKASEAESEKRMEEQKKGRDG